MWIRGRFGDDGAPRVEALWIAGGSLLLFLVSSVLGKNSKNSTTPEIANNSPLVASKPTTTPSPSLTGSDALLKTFSRENGAILAFAKASVPKPEERFVPATPANSEPPIEPVRKANDQFVPDQEDRADRVDRGSSSKKGGKKK